jgi:nucleotide-binding universal stress UspA family protein
MDTPGSKPRDTDPERAAEFELGSDGPSVLVVGIDGSETSWRALYYAFGLARRQGARVLAVFAFLPVSTFTGIPATTWTSGQELADELCAAVEILAVEHHVEAEFICTQSDAVRALVHVASTRYADAIVIGASRALVHRYFGSKVARTIRRSRCPVTIVP